MADVSRNKVVYTWRIQNFLSCHVSFNKFIQSPVFQMERLMVKDWKLVLYPRGNVATKNSKDLLLVCLSRKSHEYYPGSICVNYKIEIFDVCGCTVYIEQLNNQEILKYRPKCIRVKPIEEIFEKMKTWSRDTLTIDCTISYCNATAVSQTKAYEALTIINTDQYYFKWAVSTIGCFDWKENVTLNDSEKPDLRLSLSEQNENVKIKILKLNECLSRSIIRCRMYFLKKSGIKIASKCDVHLFGSTETWTFPTFARLKDLQYGSESSQYEYNFKCEFSVSNNSIASTTIDTYTSESHVKNKFSTQFTEAPAIFTELYTNKKFADLKLRVKDKEFLVHKNVLAARSPVFSDAFDPDMLQNKTDFIVIEDVEVDIFDSLLEFVYTENIREMDYNATLKLLLIADRYQVLALKEKCSSLILSFLDEENVCDVITIADKVCQENLKKFALQHISENVSKVFTSSRWPGWVEKKCKISCRDYM